MRASQDTVGQVSRAYTAFLSRVRGASWGGPRGSRRSRGRLRAPWDASKGPWQPSGGRLEGVVRASWGLSGGVVVLLGPFSEVSWGHIVLSLGSFRPSRGCFGPCWGSLGGLLNRFGVILTASFPVQGSREPGIARAHQYMKHSNTSSFLGGPLGASGRLLEPWAVFARIGTCPGRPKFILGLSWAGLEGVWSRSGAFGASEVVGPWPPWRWKDEGGPG